MPGGEQKTSIQRSPHYEQFMGGIFGPGELQGFTFQPGAGGFGVQRGAPGVGIGGIEEMFGGFTPQLNISPLQRQATNQLGQFMNQQAPEMQAYNLATQGLSPIITGQGQFGDIATAMDPIFQRNLQFAEAQHAAAAPGRLGSAFMQEGTNLRGQALQDYNLFIQQARQQDVANRMQAAMAMGTLAAGAGQNPFARALGAGQLGLGISQFESMPELVRLQQQQAMQQQLLGMLSQPTGQTVSGGGGIGNLAGGLLGFGAGALGGPFLGGLGAGWASQLLSSNQAPTDPYAGRNKYNPFWFRGL